MDIYNNYTDGKFSINNIKKLILNNNIYILDGRLRRYKETMPKMFVYYISKLLYYCSKTSLGCLKVLLNNGIDIDYLSGEIHYHSLLQDSCINNNIEKSILYIKLGSNIQIKNRDKATLLHLACEFNSFRVLEFLLKLNKIDINARDIYGNTCLLEACYSRNIDVIKLLLIYNADINIQTYNLELPIYICNVTNNFKGFKLILDKYNVNEYDNIKQTKIKHDNLNRLLEYNNIPYVYNCLEYDIMYIKEILKRGYNINKLLKYNNLIKYNDSISTKITVNNNLIRLVKIIKDIRILFMNIIYSNSDKHFLTKFFKLNIGLRPYIGRKISMFINPF